MIQYARSSTGELTRKDDVMRGSYTKHVGPNYVSHRHTDFEDGSVRQSHVLQYTTRRQLNGDDAREYTNPCRDCYDPTGNNGVTWGTYERVVDGNYVIHRHYNSDANVMRDMLHFKFDRNGIHEDTGTQYDPRGYDVWGRDKDDYDKNGFDVMGVHRDTDDHYNPNGYDLWGYDRDGYNARGRDRAQCDRRGFGFGGHNVRTRSAYDEHGYDYRGFDSDGIHQRTGTRYDEKGYDTDGYNSYGFDEKGYDMIGYDQHGYDHKGFDGNGIHRVTGTRYNEEGYDADDYGRDGYNCWGFNVDGRHRDTGMYHDQNNIDDTGCEYHREDYACDCKAIEMKEPACCSLRRAGYGDCDVFHCTVSFTNNAP
ncbi:MAG: hypothetical protein F4X82_03125 [Candidatus Spechtbacteria bacterium SB0662_bin_43]|uniref:Uncharacterized protein n=1 Tax=Candidatus Spechtbacteria bacterium SB0662_bin_43 TaxID=2604897 RepID=A0A845DEN8_9BACT|nr:hypothetical protein [Candidatus Spechtbacteria bacterium SB0662_bin_43]